jgi:hypothetical protein
MTGEDAVLAGLRADFPGWAIGQPPVLAGQTGEAGAWMATRKELLSAEQVDSGLSHTLTAGTAEQLRDALAAQQKIMTGVSRRPA